jgi:TfoX/Sxy family transcriptional regulator of competence genes
MAHDYDIQEAVDAMFGRLESVTSKRMFGGVCYLHRGNMALGVYKDNLIVRLGSQEQAQTFVESGEALPFDITGRPMKGWIMVPKSQLASQSDYRRWADMALAFTKSLPPK